MNTTESIEASKRSQVDAQLIRLEDVLKLSGLGRSSMYAYIRAGTFPKPVKLGLRASAWVKSEVLAWVQLRIEQRH